MENNYFDKAIGTLSDMTVNNYEGERKIIYLKRPTAYPTPAVVVNHWGFFKKIGKGLGNLGKFVGKEASQGTKFVSKEASQAGKFVAKEAVQGAKFAVKTITNIAGFAILLPFMPLMKRALKKKGFSTNNNPKDVAQLFYSHIVVHNSFEPPMNFDQMYMPTEHINYADILDSATTATQGTPLAIVPPIIKFIKDLINKKQAGQTLPPALAAIASDGLNVQNQLTTADNQIAAGGLNDDGTGTSPTNMKGYNKGLKTKKGVLQQDESAIASVLNKDAGSPMLDFKNPMVIGGIAAVFLIIVVAVAKK